MTDMTDMTDMTEEKKEKTIKLYNVTWELPIPAESAIDAAMIAREIQLDRDSESLVFSVSDHDYPDCVFTIDLTGQTIHHPDGTVERYELRNE